jgi:hypothetical protein
MTPVQPDQQKGDWQQRLAQIVELVKEMSRQTDPQEMVRSYGERMWRLQPTDRRISFSRRGLTAPMYRITRSTTWPGNINPWTEKDRLPLLNGGLIASLIYGDKPQIIDKNVFGPLKGRYRDPANFHEYCMTLLFAFWNANLKVFEPRFMPQFST